MTSKNELIVTKVIFTIITLFCIFPFIIIFVKGFSVSAYYKVFLATSIYLKRFWISIFLSGTIAFLQILISVFAGFGFAKYDFFGKRFIYFLLLILMILPIQVLIVPEYMLIRRIGLWNNYLSLILPYAFLPLGTFIMTESFKAIPNEIIDASLLDGCNVFSYLIIIALRMNSGAICSVGILSFIDAWNMVEQPIVFMKGFDQYPLSVALAFVFSREVQVQYVSCLLALIPPLSLFWLFNKQLVEGIAIGELK